MLYKARIEGYLVYLDKSYPNSDLYSKSTVFNRYTKKVVNTYSPIFTKSKLGEYIIGLGAFRILYSECPLLFTIETTNLQTHSIVKTNLSEYLVLRPYQSEALATVLNTKGGIVRLPTGSGKGTIEIAYASICLEVGHVLLLVPNNVAKDTMLARCCQYDIPVVSYADVRSNKLINNTVIISVPTALANDVKSDKNGYNRSRITTIISDECHHLSAKTWHSIFSGLPNVERSFGFSATIPTVESRLKTMDLDAALMTSYTGPVIYAREAKDPDISKYLDIPDIYEIEYTWPNPIEGNDWSKISLAIEKNTDRQKFIASVVNEVCKNNFTCLSVVTRCNVADIQFNYIDHPSIKWFGAGVWEGNHVKVEGDSILEYVKSNLRTNVMSIIATNHLNEAADIPELDVVILSENVQPKIVIQRSGRTVRKGGKKSKVINIYDSNSGVLEYQSKKRRTHLEKEYGVKSIRITMDEMKDYFI